MELARDLRLPVLIGTEMNKYGQPLVDDLDVPALRPYAEDFVNGACFLYGHTVLHRALRLGYQSEWARVFLPTRGERVNFYTQVGSLWEPGADLAPSLTRDVVESGPEAVLKALAQAG